MPFICCCFIYFIVNFIWMIKLKSKPRNSKEISSFFQSVWLQCHTWMAANLWTSRACRLPATGLSPHLFWWHLGQDKSWDATDTKSLVKTPTYLIWMKRIGTLEKKEDAPFTHKQGEPKANHKTGHNERISLVWMKSANQHSAYEHANRQQNDQEIKRAHAQTWTNY